MPLRFTINGAPEGEVKSLFNAIEASPNCISIRTLPAHKHRDGESITQTFVCEMREARRYERSEKPARDTSGYVYLLETDKLGVYKIGKTLDPKSRRETFKLNLPMEVKYLHLIQCSDMHTVEKGLHKRFASKRLIKSEFFRLSEDDVEYICSL